MRKLVSLVLSDDRPQQGRIKVWFVAAMSAVLFLSIQELQVYLGLLDAWDAHLVVATTALTYGIFYGMFRAGLNRRFADPGMTLPQLTVATGLSIWSYAITGPTRGAILILLMVNLIYGVFSLEARAGRRFAAVSLVALAGAMLLRHRQDPLAYPAKDELIHFLFAVVGTSAMALLSDRLSALREALAHKTVQLRQLATRDELTQTLNRRHMTELVAHERAEHAKTQAPMCVALLDLDNFKRINDSYGHPVGDLVLQRFAKVAREVLRSRDLLCRWGGEEFLVLFPGTSCEQAERALARLHDRMRAEVIEALPEAARITFSAGLTPMLAAETLEATTERADQAMYRAKHGGRDRTAVVHAHLPPVPAHALPQAASARQAQAAPMAH